MFQLRVYLSPHQQGYKWKTKYLNIFLQVCKGLSIDDVGVSRDTVIQEIRPGAGFGTGDFVEEKVGGATVERLLL